MSKVYDAYLEYYTALLGPVASKLDVETIAKGYAEYFEDHWRTEFDRIPGLWEALKSEYSK